MSNIIHTIDSDSNEDIINTNKDVTINSIINLNNNDDNMCNDNCNMCNDYNNCNICNCSYPIRNKLGSNIKWENKQSTPDCGHIGVTFTGMDPYDFYPKTYYCHDQRLGNEMCYTCSSKNKGTCCTICNFNGINTTSKNRIYKLFKIVNGCGHEGSFWKYYDEGHEYHCHNPIYDYYPCNLCRKGLNINTWALDKIKNNIMRNKLKFKVGFVEYDCNDVVKNDDFNLQEKDIFNNYHKVFVYDNCYKNISSNTIYNITKMYFNINNKKYYTIVEIINGSVTSILKFTKTNYQGNILDVIKNIYNLKTIYIDINSNYDFFCPKCGEAVDIDHESTQILCSRCLY